MIQQIEEKSVMGANATVQNEQVLLATAIVSAMNEWGQLIKVRALIDFGSQGSMKTEYAANLLQLKPKFE